MEDIQSDGDGCYYKMSNLFEVFFLLFKFYCYSTIKICAAGSRWCL